MIYRMTGLGVMESPHVIIKTNYEYDSLDEAMVKKNLLWYDETTKEERNSNWCYINYYIEDENKTKYW